MIPFARFSRTFHENRFLPFDAQGEFTVALDPAGGLPGTEKAKRPHGRTHSKAWCTRFPRLV